MSDGATTSAPASARDKALPHQRRDGFVIHYNPIDQISVVALGIVRVKGDISDNPPNPGIQPSADVLPC